MRIVDADDAVNRFEELKPKGSSLDVRYAYGVSVGLEMAKHVTMSELPTVDAVPARHGHWVRWHEEVHDSFGVAYVPHCKCSECGMKFDPYIANYMNYCSNCGVKLDGKDGEQNG